MADLRELLVTFGSVVKPDDTQLDEVFADVKEGVGLIHALASVIVDTHSIIFAGLIHALASVIVDTHSLIFAGLIRAIRLLHV